MTNSLPLSIPSSRYDLLYSTKAANSVCSAKKPARAPHVCRPLTVTDADAALAALFEDVAQAAVTRVASVVDRAPNIAELFASPAQADALDGDTPLVFGAGDSQVLRRDVQLARERLEDVLRVAVRLLHGKVDVGRLRRLAH